MQKTNTAMFQSMSSRIFALVAGVIILTTSLLIYTVHSQARTELLKIQEQNAAVLLTSVKSAVENAHKDIIFFKTKFIEHRKQEVKNEVDIAFQILNSYKEKADKGLLSSEEAKKTAMNLIKKIRFNNGLGYFWISDTKRPYSTLLMHPVFPELEGQPIKSPKYNVKTDSNEEKNLSQYFHEITSKTGENFANYYWYRPDNKNSKELKPKLSYVKLFKPWQWIISSGIYIEDIEKIEQIKLKSAVNSLKSAFNEKKIQDSGYMFLFTGSKKILIHPALESQDGSKLINPSTNNYILDDIIKAVKNNKNTFYYIWDKPGLTLEKKFKKVAYLSYYEPLDWYINVTYYIDDIEKPIWNLGKYMLLVSGFMLLAALIIAAIISKSISSPLQKLANSAGSVMEEGLAQVNIPIIGSLETKKLAIVLQKTFKKINKTTEKLKNNEENLRVTLNSIGDAVIATDIKGNITRINSVAQNLTGWTSDEAAGENISNVLKLVYMENKGFIEIPAQKILDKATSTQLKNNLILISKDKKEYQISNSGAPIKNDNGKVIGFVFVFRDVTEEIYIHEQLRQAQKMKAIGQLAGGIAHDFNNILGGIVMTVDLLETKIETTPETQKYFNMIIQSSKRAADLISKLLAFARKQPEASTAIDIIKPLKEAVEIVEPTIDKRIKINKSLSKEPLFVIGNPSQLQSAFLNILINASHSMPEGGEISIISSIIDLDQSYCTASQFDINPGNYAKIEIKDTGCGIPDKDLKRIFEPFFTTKSEGKGTGLGLSAVLGTISQHKGEINVITRLNSGTSFQILLPLSKNSNIKNSNQIFSPIKGHGTILVVDDEYAVRAAASDILSAFGYTVITAEHGKQAIDIFQKNPDKIDLVILDMIMPEMNGKDCFIELKKISSGVKVLIASGFAKEEELDYLKNQGIKGFITKPFRANELSQAVHDSITI